jgi:hypothetical protein
MYYAGVFVILFAIFIQCSSYEKKKQYLKDLHCLFEMYFH